MRNQHPSLGSITLGSPWFWRAIMIFLSAVLSSGCSPATLETLPCDTQALEERSESLYSEGKFEALFREMVRCADEGMPEAQFAAGMLAAADGAEEITGQAREELDSQAVEWIRAAALSGHVEAAGVLADAYENGWLGLPKNSKTAQCLRLGVGDGAELQECLAPPEAGK